MLRGSIRLQGYPELIDWVLASTVLWNRALLVVIFALEGVLYQKSSVSIHLLIVIPENIINGEGAQQSCSFYRF